LVVYIIVLVMHGHINIKLYTVNPIDVKGTKNHSVMISSRAKNRRWRSLEEGARLAPETICMQSETKKTQRCRESNTIVKTRNLSIIRKYPCYMVVPCCTGKSTDSVRLRLSYLL